MKKSIISLGLSLLGVMGFHAAMAECSTQTRSVTDGDGNVLYSATCTRCDDDPTVARIKAGICALNALNQMIEDEAEAPLQP